MVIRLAFAVLAVLAASAHPAVAQPAPGRIAVLVGANEPIAGRGRLKFGHEDAAKMASVLTSVAGFRKQDVFVLKDPSAGDLLSALDAATRRLADRPDSLLYFYYSGHADEQALYPGGQAVPLTMLRALMDQSRVSVRIGMVDACHGGAWTRAKGLRGEQPFPVQRPVSLDAEGSVLIAASSGLESAHESDELRGSFFTHHFVSGLRGAADRNGNGEVTLTEAFDYAKDRTIRDSLRFARQPQHPSFALNLRGRRDLVLAQIARSPSTLALSQQNGPLELVHLESGVALLELPPGPRQVKLAVPPGMYLVRKRFAGGVVSIEVPVRAGGGIDIDEGQLTVVGRPELVAKSVRPPAAWPPQPDSPYAPEGVRAGVVATVVAAGVGLGLGIHYGIQARRVDGELAPFRRSACRSEPRSLCGEDGVTRLGALDPLQSARAQELDERARRLERNQYLSLSAFALSALVSIPLVERWLRGGRPAFENDLVSALDLAPTWVRGPGFVAATRF